MFTVYRRVFNRKLWRVISARGSNGTALLDLLYKACVCCIEIEVVLMSGHSSQLKYLFIFRVTMAYVFKRFLSWPNDKHYPIMYSGLFYHYWQHETWNTCVVLLPQHRYMWETPQAHGAWISFPPPPFLYYPPFFKIFIIIRFSSFDNISRRHTSWIIRVFCVHCFSIVTVWTCWKKGVVEKRGSRKRIPCPMRLWETPYFIYISVIFLDRNSFEDVLLYFLTMTNMSMVDFFCVWFGRLFWSRPGQLKIFDQLSFTIEFQLNLFFQITLLYLSLFTFLANKLPSTIEDGY